jgi:hypothetical protein
MNVYISAYFNVNMGIDIVCQALSVFKIGILLLIVIAGASNTLIFFVLLSQHILIKDGSYSVEKLVFLTHMPTFAMPLLGAPTAVMM